MECWLVTVDQGIKETLGEIYQLAVPNSLSEVLNAVNLVKTAADEVVNKLAKNFNVRTKIDDEAKNVKDKLRLLIAFINAGKPVAINESWHCRLQEAGLKLNYKIKDFLHAAVVSL
jgi:hypothetical protein